MSKQIMAPRGTKDVLPSESYKWQYVEGVFRDVAAQFGYMEHRFPAFEHTELFVRGVGDTTDVVQKEMYTFLDKGDRSVTLRPEGTASVVRSYIEHSLFGGGLPVKSYYIVPNFRYEKPQAGRLREFHQYGAECFGPADAAADGEMIGLVSVYFSALGLNNIRLEINSIGCPECRPAFYSALRAYFESHKEELCGTCNERLVKNPLRILDCKSPRCAAIAEAAPLGLDYLCDDCLEHFDATKASLDAMGIEYTVNPRIVRGLDYYTRTVFEFISDEIGAQSTICGGGRYDGLVETLGGQPTPALGFAGGLERLLLVMEAQKIEIPKPEPLCVFVGDIGKAAGLVAQKLVHRLRERGCLAERDLMGRSLKAQMKYADKLGARFTLVLGEDEVASGKARLKDMTTGDLIDLEVRADSIIRAVCKQGY